MFLYFVSVLFLILFLLLTMNIFKDFQITEKIFGVFLISCGYLVFILELAGLFNGLNKPILILFLQALILLTTGLLNLKFGFGLPTISVHKFQTKIHKIPDLIRRNIGVTLFFCLILTVYIFLAYLQVRFPQNTTDSLLNHLSRVGHWLQQGSLKPFNSFNNIGNSYPIINSLLMFWSIVFLRSDKLVGYVQFTAAIMVAISIYAIGKELGFPKKSSFLAGLFFLTFPIVLFESITAQNDLTASSFLIIAFYFLIRCIHKPDIKYLVLSILSISLSVGTKQYAFFAIPGYIALFVFLLRKLRAGVKYIWFKSSIFAICFIVVFSSYSYFQNWIFYGNPIGEKNSIISSIEKPHFSDLMKNITINSLRLSYQFLSCEGFPPIVETGCVNTKAKLLKPILTTSRLNLESDEFLLDKNEPFRLDTKYGLNEESAWYGIVGFLLIFLAVAYGSISFIKKRNIEGLILIASSFVFLILVSLLKIIWAPYVGRYLIFSVVITLHLSAGFLNDKGIINKIFLWSIGLITVFIMIYSVLNNDSRPIISQYQFLKLQRWGKDHSLLIQKIAYKLTPLVRNDLDLVDFWSASDAYIETFGNQEYLSPLELVESNVIGDSTLGILNPAGYSFPDYLFFGDSFNRKLAIFTSPEEIQDDHPRIDFLLTSPDFYQNKFPGYQLIGEKYNWRLFRNTNGN